MEKLGIIGGMGPAATARLFSRVVDFTDAACDQDHLDVTVLNRPSVPDRTAYLLARPGAHPFAPMLQDMARTLEEMGCAVLAMPCNTAHAALGEIESVLSSARLIDMPYEAAAFACSLGCARVGLLATDGTLSAGVFQRASREMGVQSQAPEAFFQKHVMSVIYDHVKAARAVPAGLFEEALDNLVACGCDGFILGCTELSLLGMPARYKGKPVIDALDVLAWRCVRECGAQARDLAKAFA